MTLTEQQVDEIVAEDDPVLRNLRISVAYGRLGEDFAKRVDDRNLSWCGFGAWASEGVGSAIRHHQTDKSRVLRCFRAAMPRHYARVAVVAAEAFARGNRLVFDDIGRAFARFHAAVDEGSVAAFLADLPAEAPEGVDLVLDPPVGLADAFRAYRAAMDEEDLGRRAQLVALANLHVAHVEQVRLQQPIVDAFGSLLTGPLRRGFTDTVMARLLTETTLTLPLGPERIRPGRRMPRLAGRCWPDDLAVLDEALFAPFAAVLARDRPDADDWRSLKDRLRYIGALMRSRQQAPELFTQQPFTPDQVTQIEAGVVPAELRPKVIG